jgi:hypothetical protein
MVATCQAKPDQPTALGKCSPGTRFGIIARWAGVATAHDPEGEGHRQDAEDRDAVEHDHQHHGQRRRQLREQPQRQDQAPVAMQVR